MATRKTLPRALVLLAAALGAAAVMDFGAPAQAQDYVCPDGYYYVAGYGCAPLDYWYAPTILVPGWGYYGGRGWRGGGWHGGGYHGGFHGGGGGHGGGGHHR